MVLAKGHIARETVSAPSDNPNERLFLARDSKWLGVPTGGLKVVHVRCVSARIRRLL